MKRSVVLAVLLVALLFSLVMAVFADPHETPNDPHVNPDANACFTGGSMAGKCGLDEQLWIAGWYAIRFEYGMISGDQIPDQYKWLLPQTTEEPQAEATEPVKPL